MSRLQAGALALAIQPIDVADIISAAVTSLGPVGAVVVIQVPEDTPEVQADPALLERAIANLVQNAVRHSPADSPQITASSYGTTVDIRVIDSGPGVPETEWDQIFQPFQRLGDRDNTSGVGLGLALSRGLVEANVGNPEPGRDTRRRADHDNLTTHSDPAESEAASADTSALQAVLRNEPVDTASERP